MRGSISLAAAARVSMIVLAIGSAPGVARASAKQNPNRPFLYETSGAVNIGAAPASISGSALLQFQGLSGASFDPKTGGTMDLGQFVIAPGTTTNGQTTTYTDTPFEVEIKVPEYNKINTVPVLDKVFPSLGQKFALKTVIENSLLLKGHLDGTVSANGQVNVTETVTSVKLGSFDPQGSDHVTHYTFPIRYSQLKLPPSWMMGNQSLTTPVLAAPAAETLTITPTPTPTPEPSTILLFAAAFGGLALARRRPR